MWSLLLLLALLIPILAIILDSQVGRAIASRLERRSLDQPPELLLERIGYLEGEVERLSQEIGRLDEQSQFLQNLLEERPGGEKALPSGDPRG
jgi:hypothetical protein